MSNVALDFCPRSDAGTAGAVGVFVSSTFRDMREERDLLVKQTFPALRHHYSTGGVVVSEVDLRWGVTSEQVADGKVLPVCFAEINRCRPFFIALLGERYGTPHDIPPDVVSREPWLTSYADASVTELEIRHGLLRHPDVLISPTMWFKSKAPVLGDFEQLVLLGVLRLELQDASYGAAIREEIHARSRRDVSINAVYTTLDRLENKGLVKSWIGDPTPQRGGRRRKFYALRPSGLAALRQAYQTFTAMADGFQTRLETK
jgi:DNA-binding PadR family transcriptional regulator